MALFGAPRAFLGLDIGPQMGALVELVDRGHRVELATYAVFSLPDSNSSEEIARHVEEAMNRAQVSADVAAFSLPSQLIFSAALTLPNMPADQRTRAINFKAKHIIPATPAQVKLSSVHQQRPDGSVDVYLTAIPKQLIAWYWQLAKRLHLEVGRLEPEVFSLIRTHHLEPNTTTLLCSVNHGITFHLVTDTSPIASQTLDISAPQLSQQAAIAEVTRAAQQLTSNRKLDKIIVTGTSAAAPTVVDRLATLLERPVEITNPWHHVAYPAGLESVVTELGPRLATAIGLARAPLAHRI